MATDFLEIPNFYDVTVGKVALRRARPSSAGYFIGGIKVAVSPPPWADIVALSVVCCPVIKSTCGISPVTDCFTGGGEWWTDVVGWSGGIRVSLTAYSSVPPVYGSVVSSPQNMSSAVSPHRKDLPEVYRPLHLASIGNRP